MRNGRAKDAGLALLGGHLIVAPGAALVAVVEAGGRGDDAVHDDADGLVLSLLHARHGIARLDPLDVRPRVRRLVGERQQDADKARTELRRKGGRVAGDHEQTDKGEHRRPPGRPPVDAVAHVQVGGRLAGVGDDGLNQARREAALVAASELKRVDELVAQFRMFLLHEGGEEIVAPVLQHAPHHQKEQRRGQTAPQQGGQNEAAGRAGLQQVVGGDQRRQHDGGAG